MAKEAKNPQESAVSKTLGQSIRLVVATVLVVIMVALVLDNRKDVTIGWVLGNTTAPLALAIIVTFVLGLGVGWLVAQRRRR